MYNFENSIRRFFLTTEILLAEKLQKLHKKFSPSAHKRSLFQGSVTIKSQYRDVLSLHLSQGYQKCTQISYQAKSITKQQLTQTELQLHFDDLYVKPDNWFFLAVYISFWLMHW